MKRSAVLVLFFCFLMVSVQAQSDFHKDRIIVKIKGETKFRISQKIQGGEKISLCGEDKVDELNMKFKCKNVKHLFTEKPDKGMENWFVLEFPETVNIDDLLGEYCKVSDKFEVVEKYPIPVVASFNDPLFNPTQSKSLFDSFFPQAWDVEPGGASNVVIGIIDNGLDWNHPDISINNLWQNTTGGTSGYGEDADRDGVTLVLNSSGQITFDPGDINGIDDDGNGYIDDFSGWDFDNSLGDNVILPDDPQYDHGLNIFGIIGATANNGLGSVGVANRNKIIHIKGGDYGFIGNYIPAIYYLANMGAKVINMSYFSPGDTSSAERAAINYAWGRGCVLVGAGGYTDYGNPIKIYTYPAAYDHVIGTGVLENDALHMRTNSYVNDKLDVLGSRTNMFPGYFPGSGYSYRGSMHTSGVTALTSGLAALLFCHNPTWTNEQVVNQILMTCTSRDDENRAASNSYNFDFYGLIGNGILNAYKALTFNGTISENTVWAKTLKVFHNITVNSGTTLTLRPNTTLDFQSGTTFVVNGKLVVQGNLTINKDIQIKSGGSIDIAPGATLTFTNGASLVVNGVMTADGAAGKIYIKSGSDTETWGKIIFDGATAANSYMNNVDLKNGNEIRCLNGANVKIWNSYLTNFYQGIYIYNAQPDIRNNHIINPNQNGIYGEASAKSPVIVGNTITKTNHSGQGVFLLNGTVPYVANNDISGCDYGVYFGGGAHAYFTEYVGLPDEPYKMFWPNNRFQGNNTALCAAWGGFISGGSSGYNSWYNTIKNNISYEAYAYQSGTIYAQYNYWGNVTPRTYKDGTSTVSVTNVLGLDPWEEPDLMSVTTKDNSAASKTTLSKTSLTASETDPVDLLEGIKLEKEGRLGDAISWYKSLINSDKYQSFALTELMRVKNMYAKADILSYLEDISKVKKNSYLLKMLGDSYLQTGQFDKAMAWFDNAVSSSASEQEALDAKFSKLFAFINVKKDLGKAQEVLSDIKKSNLSDIYFSSRVEIAENLMGDPSAYSANKGEKQENSGQSLENSGIVTEYALSQNYPNPFNPSTVINFEIPQASKVSLRVYDILGKEVATLVDGYKEMGRYSVQFNAKDIPSGMYIYEIRANNFIRSGKMLLLK
ncbi:MAG: S8 family serine peptidase [Syntrophomonadaceae bacterium]